MMKQKQNLQTSDIFQTQCLHMKIYQRIWPDSFLFLVRTGSIYLWLLETVPKGIMVNSLYKTLFALTHLFECVINSFEGRLLVIVHYSSAAMYNICSIFFSSFANTHIHAMVWSVVPFTAIFIKLIWKQQIWDTSFSHYFIIYIEKEHTK